MLGGFLLHLLRREVTEGRVDTLPIVEAFDVLKQVSFCLLLSCVVFVMNKLSFERVEKTFHGGIVLAIALA